MHEHIIEEVLAALSPAIRSRKKAQALLQKYCSDKIALIWTTQDVHRAANERETVLTEAQAKKILMELHQQHNAQYGLQWKDLYDAIENSGLGRDITKSELSRFVHKDILAIQKPSRSTQR